MNVYTLSMNLAEKIMDGALTNNWVKNSSRDLSE